jgi:lysine-specific histone demethylase 1
LSTPPFPSEHPFGSFDESDKKFDGIEEVFLNGYGRIVDALASGSMDIAGGESAKGPLTIVTSKKVVGITQAGAKLNLAVSDGTTMSADHVIFTGSAGVLKSKSVSFNPPLSQPKQDSITRVGFGNVIKVGLLFDESFWPEQTHYFVAAGTTGDMAAAERFSYFLNLVPAVNRPILFTFVFGGQATPVESWTDARVWADIRANLVKLFGAAAVPETANAMWRSSWASSENFRGAYSFAGVSTQECDFDVLAAAEMGGHLHFAGEHTFGSARGTVHGGFLSGLRAAAEVLAASGGCKSSAIEGVQSKSSPVMPEPEACASAVAAVITAIPASTSVSTPADDASGAAACGAFSGLSPGVLQERFLDVAGTKRRYLLYVPKSAVANGSRPLWLNFHGMNPTAAAICALS